MYRRIANTLRICLLALTICVSNAFAAAPGPASLIAPTGSAISASPTFEWGSVEGATWYSLWVNDQSGNPIDTWYSSSEAGCDTGGTCTVSPGVALVGNANWWVQTWNSDGYGPWSQSLTFTTFAGPPAAVELNSPIERIADTTPTYEWSADSQASWYFLWVESPAGSAVITEWFTAAQAGCSVGVGVCRVEPDVEIVGAGRWWVRGWNSVAGAGPWSQVGNFEVGAGIEFSVSPFLDDPNVLTFTNTDNGASATIVGSRNQDGSLNEFSYARVTGLAADGRVSAMPGRHIVFVGDNGSELQIQLDADGNATGASFRESPTSEVFSSGNLPSTQIDSLQRSTIASTPDLSQTGRPINITITKCGGLPQSEFRVVKAETTVNGAIGTLSRADVAPYTGWQKNEQTYSSFIPNYDRRWEGNVEDALLWVIESTNVANAAVCEAANALPAGPELLALSGTAACVSASALLASAGITLPVAPLAFAACESAVSALAATCRVRSVPGVDTALELATERAINALELTATVEVSVSTNDSFTPTDSQTLVLTQSNGSFGVAPLSFDLHGGAVETETKITSNPNPSRAGESASIQVEVVEKNGGECQPTGELRLVENGESILHNAASGGSESLTKAFDFPQDVRYQAYYSGDAVNFNDSQAQLHTHQVTQDFSVSTTGSASVAIFPDCQNERIEQTISGPKGDLSVQLAGGVAGQSNSALANYQIDFDNGNPDFPTISGIAKSTSSIQNTSGVGCRSSDSDSDVTLSTTISANGQFCYQIQGDVVATGRDRGQGSAGVVPGTSVSATGAIFSEPFVVTNSDSAVIGPTIADGSVSINLWGALVRRPPRAKCARNFWGRVGRGVCSLGASFRAVPMTYLFAQMSSCLLRFSCGNW